MFGKFLIIGLIRSHCGHWELLPVMERGDEGRWRAARASSLGQGNCQLAESKLMVSWFKGLFLNFGYWLN